MPVGPGTRTGGPLRRVGLALSALWLSGAAAMAADPPVPVPVPVPIGRFVATCDDLGHLCFADTCGRDQIEAALACRAACPASVVRRVEPVACPIPAFPLGPVLRRRG